MWLERPNAEDFALYYPEAAVDRGQGGRVTLDCVVAAHGRIACRVTSEDPPGWGFGEAALRISMHFRMAPATRDGRPTSGGRVRVPIRFVASEPEPEPAQ
jgi:protein TonB